MKSLYNILQGIEVLKIIGSTEVLISGICIDSRMVEAGAVFVAISGTQSDGHQYIDNAIEKGASAIVCQNMPAAIASGVCYVQLKDSAAAAGEMASAYFEHPSQKMQLVGITGTNGKTTIATLLYTLFTELGYSCGLISTIRNLIAGEEIPSTHTTPDAITLNRMLRSMLDHGCTHCFMEVSSHAVVQERIAGLHFCGGVFTNLTHDHLDYHKTFPEYLKAKKRFFDTLTPSAFALTNLDDKNGEVMLQNCQAKHSSYALKRIADFKGRIVENLFEGLHMNVDSREVWFTLVGTFNAYNLLAIYGTSVLMGEEPGKVLEAMSILHPAEGRFEYLRSKEGLTAVIDYAHTPDALENVLDTIHQTGRREKRILTVVGAGGNRDKTKRPLMAAIAAKLSDVLILTSDNPRDENPEDILDDMIKGVSDENRAHVLRITGRKEAIQTAVMLAKPGDVLLVAGKGHEKYQEIKGVKHPFDDKQIVKEFLLNR